MEKPPSAQASLSATPAQPAQSATPALRHLTHIRDLGVEGVRDVLETALQWKATPPGKIFPDRILGMVFFNASLRTRTSFEAVMIRSGGAAIVLDVGGGVWKLEHRVGVAMTGDRAEHVREAVPVLSRFVDMLAVRTFADLKDPDEDEQDLVIQAFRDNATVPLISMESAREHPCQGMADIMTLREKFGDLKGMKVCMTWAPHIKPLPQAVPNSFLLSAAAAGCDITVAHPPGFELHRHVTDEAAGYAQQSGAVIRYTDNQAEAFKGAVAVYAKCWGPAHPEAPAAEVNALYENNRHWMVTRKAMDAAGSDPVFMHCLPLRRNVVAEDAVLDHPRSVVVDQAENRFHVQRAMLRWMTR